MPKYSKEARKAHMERVRGVMIVRPNASATEIANVLTNSREAPLPISPQYVTDLMKKIYGERAMRWRTVNTSIRLSQIQDKIRLIDERLWRESSDQNSPAVARVMALKQLLDNEIAMAKLETEAGIIPVADNGASKRIRRLTDEQKRAIITTMRLWGIVRDDDEQKAPDNTIETIAIVTDEYGNLPTAQVHAIAPSGNGS